MPLRNITLSHDSVLMVIDIQERLQNAMQPNINDEVIKNVSTLLTGCNRLSIPAIITEQYPAGLGSTDHQLKQLIPESTPVVEKTAFSAAQVFGVEQKLKAFGRKQIVLTGMEAHICVLQTGTDLLRHGFEVFIVADAICSRTDKNYENAINRLRAAGAVITNTESVVFEWLCNSENPHFKELSKLIR